MNLCDHALRYARGGWRVFPTTRDKIPLVKDWPNVATTNPEQIREWWQEYPRASIGYATGALVVIDIDGTSGLATRRDTEAQGLEWPVTLTALTGRREGGLHAYYRTPEGAEIRNVNWRPGATRCIGPHIDVRGKGGLTVLPPSPHKSGRPYQWVVRVEPVELPQWMVERLRPPVVKPTPQTFIKREANSRYAQAALDGECQAVETAPDGTQNTQINDSAFSLGRFIATGELSEAVVRDALLAAAIRGGHPEKRARATITSGLRAGAQR